MSESNIKQVPDIYTARLAQSLWKTIDQSSNGKQSNTTLIPWNPDELRKKAIEKTGVEIAAFYDEYDSASGTGGTMLQNINALRSYHVIPRHLSSFSKNGEIQQINSFNLKFSLKHTLYLESKTLGKTVLESPTMIYVAPMGAQKSYGANEITGIQGATKANVVWCQSSIGSYIIEDIINSKNKINGSDNKEDFDINSSPFSMYQLYLTTDNDVNMSMISRAKLAGYKVVMLTMDTGAVHITDKSQDLKSYPVTNSLAGTVNCFADPVFNYKLYLHKQVVATQDHKVLEYTSKKTCQNIDDLQKLFNIKLALQFWASIVVDGMKIVNCETNLDSPLYSFSIKNIADKVHSIHPISDAFPNAYNIALPLVVKGCTNVDEALLIQSLDVDGIVVSNHGGRFQDSCISSLDALKEIYPAVKKIHPNFGVWFDSGIRRGEDILIAYALGAEFVGIGRPVIYANIINGKDGTYQVLTQLVAMARRAAQIVGLSQFNVDTFTKVAKNIIVKKTQ